MIRHTVRNHFPIWHMRKNKQVTKVTPRGLMRSEVGHHSSWESCLRKPRMFPSPVYGKSHPMSPGAFLFQMSLLTLFLKPCSWTPGYCLENKCYPTMFRNLRNKITLRVMYEPANHGHTANYAMSSSSALTGRVFQHVAWRAAAATGVDWHLWQAHPTRRTFFF